MLDMILKLLCILGIVLLVLLGIIILVLLLFLFFPVSYRFSGEKNQEELTFRLRVRWLFGLVRAGCIYPEPGRFVVKVLWFSLFDSHDGKQNASPAKKQGKKDAAGRTVSAGMEKQAEDQTLKQDQTNENQANRDKTGKNQTGQNRTGVDSERENAQNAQEDSDSRQTLWETLLAKYEKIRYTIKAICDRIKHISDDLVFYRSLLEDRENKKLFTHVCRRIGKALYHIFPRKCRADIIFGTGSPDTTGYAYGVYGMFSPKLGQDIIITPDFTKQILVGKIDLSGHLTAFVLLANVLAVLLDRRLWSLIRRIKHHNKKSKTNIDADCVLNAEMR